MPSLQYVDDLLVDPQYFEAISHVLSQGQDLQNPPQVPQINLVHLFLFAMSLASVFDELWELAPTLSVPEPMDLLTLFLLQILGMSSACSFPNDSGFLLLVSISFCMSYLVKFSIVFFKLVIVSCKLGIRIFHTCDFQYAL